MKHFPTIEKLDTGLFSWLFSSPLSSTLSRYMVELIANSQVFQQAGASVRQARQGSCGLCCESEDDLGFVEALTDLLFPFCPCANIAIMPDINQSLWLERSQIRLEFIEVWFIFTRITEEDFH